ncbi:MAG: signal peptidase I [Planctomycetes bacterium]|nr:signal peptidase I [Planctomycetota bacterium]
MAETEQKNASSEAKETTREAWTGLGAFVATVVALRFLIFEPFKIPSGSMEPTLIGHPDYGDRIVTNLLAYTSLADTCWKLGLTLVFILGTLVTSRSLLKRGRAWVVAGALLAAVAAFAGIFLAWQNKAIASEPERFDVVVFRYKDKWSDERTGGAKNYIKRLIGLPGDTIVISGGDLFLKDPATGKEEIIRKWETGDDLQESLWQPVSLSTFRVKEIPAEADASQRQRLEAENDRAFPWIVEKPEGSKLERTPGEPWVLDVDGEASLTYAHQVTNAYIKMGRWPFQHLGCPKAHLPPLVDEETGVKMTDPNEADERIRPYLPNSWSGVACPNCGQLRFPLSRDRDIQPRIVPVSGASGVKVRLLNARKTEETGNEYDLDVEVMYGCLLKGDIVHADQPAKFVTDGLTLVDNDGEHDVEVLDAGQSGRLKVRAGSEFKPGRTYDWTVLQDPDERTPYYYGGYNTVGDLKLEIEFLSRTDSGAIELVAGSDRHRAGWIVSLGDKPAPPVEPGRHEFAPEGAKAIEKGTRHRLSLAYVDGTLIGSLDGEVVDRQKLDIAPPGPEAIRSFARVRFLGAAKVEVYRLDLYRDLYHTMLLDEERLRSIPEAEQTHHRDLRHPQAFAERMKTGRFEMRVPAYDPDKEAGPSNQDHYLMLGDNSPSSRDSRCWGFVPRDHLVGRASFVWWPPSRCRIMK